MFGYFILTPISINFLANYQIDPSILNEFDIISYVSTITTLVLASGMLFQLPMVIYFLTKAGIVNKEILKNYIQLVNLRKAWNLKLIRKLVKY